MSAPPQPRRSPLTTHPGDLQLWGSASALYFAIVTWDDGALVQSPAVRHSRDEVLTLHASIAAWLNETAP